MHLIAIVVIVLIVNMRIAFVAWVWARAASTK
jgi:hypothetical protein